MKDMKGMKNKTGLIVLQNAGGGVRFIHRLLPEQFAAMDGDGEGFG
jgi:hypothetical protein